MVVHNLISITSDLLHDTCVETYDCPNLFEYAFLTLESLKKGLCSLMSPLFHVKVALFFFKDCKRKVLLTFKGVANIPNHCQDEVNTIICFVGCFIVRLWFNLGLHCLHALSQTRAYRFWPFSSRMAVCFTYPLICLHQILRSTFVVIEIGWLGCW